VGGTIRAIALLLAGLTIPGAVQAKKRTFAVFPILERDSPDSAVVQRMTTRLVQLGQRLNEVKVLSPKQLRARLQSSPAKAMTACGSDLVCIARLGRQVAADEVLLARASGKPAGVEFVFVVVDARSQEIARKGKGSAGSKLAVEAVLADLGDDIFGVSSDSLVAASSAPGGTRYSADSEVAAAEVAAETGPSEPWTPPERSTLKYATIGAGGVAGLLFAGGIAFGASSAISWNGANDRTKTQIEAQDLADRSDSQASTANLLFGLGAAAAVVAGGLFGWDWYLRDGPMWSSPEP
jgi:hypothetical protein